MVDIMRNNEGVVNDEDYINAQEDINDEDINDEDINDEDINDEDMEEGSEPEIDEETEEVHVETKAKKNTKSPRNAIPLKKKKPTVKKTTVKKTVVKVVKIKKPRTVRRPYKSMPQTNLIAKQVVTSTRVEVLQKRLGTLNNQLERYNAEVEHRVNNPETVVQGTEGFPQGANPVVVAPGENDAESAPMGE
jgi:hypothetical protein